MENTRRVYDNDSALYITADPVIVGEGGPLMFLTKRHALNFTGAEVVMETEVVMEYETWDEAVEDFENVVRATNHLMGLREAADRIARQGEEDLVMQLQAEEERRAREAEAELEHMQTDPMFGMFA